MKHPHLAVVLMGLVWAAPAMAATTAAPPARGEARLTLDGFLSKNCISCHGPKKQKGKLRLDTLDRNIGAGPQAEIWNHVRERLADGDMPPEDDPAKTLRERMVKTNDEYCWQCHSKMNPLGLAFENFDHFGRWRDAENGKPVDARGAIDKSGDPKLDAPVRDSLELVRRLGASDLARQVFEWPMLVLGDLGGRLKTKGRCICYPKYGAATHRTTANLYLTLLEAAGVERKTFGTADIGLRDVDIAGPLSELMA